jgi:hypothetical protein
MATRIRVRRGYKLFLKDIVSEKQNKKQTNKKKRTKSRQK